MSAIDDARAQLRDRKMPRREPPWQPPQPGDFLHSRYVMAFDATLTNCGWALFAIEVGRVVVVAKGTIRPRTDESGYLGTWDKAAQLRSELAALTGYWDSLIPLRPDIVVEAPSVGGGSRTESSLIAGMLVWMGRPRCQVISATHVSAVLLGDPRVKSAERKKRIREAVIRLCPEAAARDWNEHERDALATGLAHLHDLNRGPAAIKDIGIAVNPDIRPGTVIITGIGEDR